MADVLITSDTKWIQGNFNGSSRDSLDFEYRPLTSICSVGLHGTVADKGTYVSLKFIDNTVWTFDTSGNRGYKVGRVNGVAIADNTVLLSAIAALIP